MLIVINKMMITKYKGYIVQLLIYLIFSNLSHKISKSWMKLNDSIVGLIFIYKKDFLTINIKIYYQIIKVILKYN